LNNTTNHNHRIMFHNAQNQYRESSKSLEIVNMHVQCTTAATTAAAVAATAAAAATVAAAAREAAV
jgi:hypothetical protein